MDDRIKTIQCYQATDGSLHTDMRSAEYRQLRIDDTETANKMLEDGKSIGDILKAIGRTEHDPIFDSVTKHSLLAIPHWQCRDEPGYKVIRFDDDYTVYVYGNAGSWSGSYGNTMSLYDLKGYAKDKRSQLTPESEATK
jgi:hypothetical protein